MCSAVWLLPPFFSSLPSWLAGWPSLLPQPSPTKFPAVPAKRWGNVGVSATVRDTRRPAVGRRWSPAKILKDPGQGGCGHGKRNGIHSVSWARPQAKRSKGKRRDGTLPVSGRPPRRLWFTSVCKQFRLCGLSWPDGGARPSGVSYSGAKRRASFWHERTSSRRGRGCHEYGIEHDTDDAGVRRRRPCLWVSSSSSSNAPRRSCGWPGREVKSGPAP